MDFGVGWVRRMVIFFLSIHTATPSLENYEQVYIVHTGFAG